MLHCHPRYTKVLVGETHCLVVFCFGPKSIRKSGSETGMGEEQEERKEGVRMSKVYLER